MPRKRVDEATFSKASFATIDSLDGYLKPVTVYGLSTQAGTPTPDVPVPIVSTTGDVTVTSTSGATTSTQTLPLGATQLRSLPNGVSDRIYKDGSTWKLEQNVDYRVFNGSETWSDASVETGYFRGTTLTNLSFKSRIGMNDRLTERANTAHGAYEYKFSQDPIAIGPVYIQVTDGRIGAHTITAFKAWLSSNPVTALSDLATPITTTITDPTLITALENIRTYQGITNITASTPISGVYSSSLVRTAATNRLTAVGRQIATNRVQVT